MTITFTKQPGTQDHMRCVRADGTSTERLIPRNDALPHDLVHYAVENTLGLKQAFFGMVARGAEVDRVMESIHGPVSRRSKKMTQAHQVEALVECLHTELRSEEGVMEYEVFMEKLATACAPRMVSVPGTLTSHELDAVRISLRTFDKLWQELPVEESLVVVFPER